MKKRKNPNAAADRTTRLAPRAPLRELSTAQLGDVAGGITHSAGNWDDGTPS
jgi:hypothetical protein